MSGIPVLRIDASAAASLPAAVCREIDRLFAEHGVVVPCGYSLELIPEKPRLPCFHVWLRAGSGDDGARFWCPFCRETRAKVGAFRFVYEKAVRDVVGPVYWPVELQIGTGMRGPATMTLNHGPASQTQAAP